MADTRGNLKDSSSDKSRRLTDEEEYRRRIEALDERIQQLYDERHHIIQSHRYRKGGIHKRTAHQEEERRKHVDKGYETRLHETFREAEQEIYQDVDKLYGEIRKNMKTLDERIQTLEKEKTQLTRDWEKRVDSTAASKQDLTKESVRGCSYLVRQGGPMLENDYTNIRENLPFLVRNLIPDKLIDRLFSKGVFNDDDIETINKQKENGRSAVVRKMLMILLHCGEHAYRLFIESLQEEGFTRAVEILENVPQTHEGSVRGKVPPIEYNRIQLNLSYLINTITNPWTLIIRLYNKKVIDDEEFEQIESTEEKQTATRKLLHILLYCGPGTLYKLMQSLREEGCTDIADQLESGSAPCQESKSPKQAVFKNPKLLKAEETAKIMLEGIKEDSYPETRAYSEGCKVLNNNFILGVIGATGDGKSVLSSMVAANFLENHCDFAPLVIKLGDIDEISFSEKRNLLLIMDDILGRFDRSNVNISQFQVNFNNLYLNIKRRRAALIYVIRDYIYNDCKHVRNISDIFSNEYCIFLHRKSICLNRQEREKIIKYHSKQLQDSDIQTINEICATIFGFPSIAKLLSKLLSTCKQVEIGLFAFTSLNDFLLSNFEMFWKEYKDKYACFLLAFSLRPLSVKTLQSGSSSDVQSLVSRIQKDVLGNFRLIEALEVFENWSESFYTRDENSCFIFREFVDEAFFIHMFPKFTDLAIKFAPFQLLMEMMRTETNKRTVTSKQCDLITIDFYPNLADRFINEFKNCNFEVVFHQAFLDECFLSMLVKLEQYNDLTNHCTSIPFGIVGDFNDAGNFLHFICLHGSLTCLERVLSTATETYVESETQNGHNICDLVAISDVDAIAKLDLFVVKYKHLFKNTVLHMAVQSKQLDIVTHVLKYDRFDIKSLNRNLQTVLHSACLSEYDAPDIVKYLVNEEGIDINVKDKDGLTPLHYAVKKGKTNTTALLLKLKSDVNIEDNSGSLPIHLGCCSNASRSDVDKANIVTLLVNDGSDINHKDTNGRTPILEALSNCQKETAEYLLSKGCDVNIKDYKGTSVIQEACTNMKQHVFLINNLLQVVDFPVHEAVLWFDDVHELDKFLDTNFDKINTLNDEGELPLHKACISIYKPREKAELLFYKGAHTNLSVHPNVSLFLSTVCLYSPVSVIKFLFDINFKFDITDYRGKTSLMYCCQSVVDQVEKVQLILTNHADLNAKDYEGKDALHYSCLYSHVASVKLLIKEGLQVNDRDAKGQTPLFSCIQSNVDRIEKMQFLISKGADINVKDNKGRSFLRESYQWGDIACVKLLIKEGLGVNDRDDKGYRPLYYCIQSNVDRIEKIQFLLSVGADTNVKNNEWRSLLHESCVWGDIACVKLLIKQGINVNGRDFYGKTPLFECIQSNVDRIEKMRFLISVGADINLKDHDMRSLLHASCQWGDIACVKLLIKEGLGVNDRDDYGQTPLFSCIQSKVDRIEKMRFLISVGADINVKNKDKNSSLHVSCQSGDIACVKILIKEGLGVNDRAVFGQTPLFYCIQSAVDRIEKMQFLISKGADINVKDKKRRSLLHISCDLGDIPCVKWLIKEGGLHVNDRDRYGETPLLFCISSIVDRIICVEITEILIKAGADVNARDRKGQSILHHSVEFGDVKYVKILIEAGAKVKVKDKKGYKPIYYCCKTFFDPVEKVKLLLEAGAKIKFRRKMIKKTRSKDLREFLKT